MQAAVARPAARPAAANADPTQTNYDLGALVIEYIPTADGVNVDQSVTGDVGGTVAAMRTKTDGITANLVNFLSIGTAYHRYSNSSATPSLTCQVAGTYERDVAVPTVPYWQSCAYAYHTVGDRASLVDHAAGGDTTQQIMA